MRRYLIILMAALAFNAMAQNNRIYIEDFEIIPDSSVLAPVILANQDTTCGFQFNMTLPDGLEVEKVSMTDRIRDLGMKLEYHERNGSSVVMIYSMQLAYCVPDTIEVLTIKFKADADFKGGEVSLWKCRGARTDNTGLILSDATTRVSVPERSLVGVPIDKKKEKEQFFDSDMRPEVSSSAGKVSQKPTENKRIKK